MVCWQHFLVAKSCELGSTSNWCKIGFKIVTLYKNHYTERLLQDINMSLGETHGISCLVGFLWFLSSTCATFCHNLTNPFRLGILLHRMRKFSPPTVRFKIDSTYKRITPLNICEAAVSLLRDGIVHTQTFVFEAHNLNIPNPFLALTTHFSCVVQIILRLLINFIWNFKFHTI